MFQNASRFVISGSQFTTVTQNLPDHGSREQSVSQTVFIVLLLLPSPLTHTYLLRTRSCGGSTDSYLSFYFDQQATVSAQEHALKNVARFTPLPHSPLECCLC